MISDNIVELGEVATVKGGKRLPKGVNLIQAPNKHPYIRVRDISQSKTIHLNSGFGYVDEDTQKRISRYIVSTGDIVLSIVGSIGLISVVGESLDHANLTENCVKITDFNGIDRDFLYYYLVSSAGQEEISKGTVGAVQAKLPIKNIQQIKIPLPEMEMQRKIASFLSALDSKIELNQKIYDNLQQQAFAIFEKLLSNEHSSECSLSQIATINPKRILKKNEPARCIDMAQLSTSGGFPNGWEIKPYNGGMRFANGDTLLARITPCLENGKTAYIDFLDEGEVAFGSTEYVVIASQGEYPPEFFYCLARYPAFVDYAVKNMNGSSGRQRVSAETIGNFILPVLTNDELSEFRSTVPCLFKAIKNNSVENMSLAQLRDTLLPKLMSGEIDIQGVC